jgi:hypothetical protein
MPDERPPLEPVPSLPSRGAVRDVVDEEAMEVSAHWRFERDDDFV